MYIFEIYYHSQFQLHLNFRFIYVFLRKLALTNIYFALFAISQYVSSLWLKVKSIYFRRHIIFDFIVQKKGMVKIFRR